MLAWWAYFTHPARLTALITPRKVYTSTHDLSQFLRNQTAKSATDIAKRATMAHNAAFVACKCTLIADFLRLPYVAE